MTYNTKWCSVAAIAFLLFGARTCPSQTVLDWLPSGSANWNVNENWEEGFVPKVDFEEGANIGNGGQAVVDSDVDDIAVLSIDDGIVDIQQSGDLNVAEDGETTIGGSGVLRLSGNGRFASGSVANGGLVDLTSSNSRFQTRGNYSQTGTLKLDITSAGGPTLAVDGIATLDGTVLANFAPDVDLSFGSSWEFVNAASASTTASVVLPDDATPLEFGLQLQLTTSGGDVSIAVGNQPVLSIDRATGGVAIQNAAGGPIELTGYSVASDNGLLSLDGWQSLESQSVDGWGTANPQDDVIAELNLSNQSTLEVGGSTLSLGNLFNAELGLKPAREDISFEVSTADGRVIEGIVEYTGPANDLVLRVDPESGLGVIQNLSTHIDPFDVTGYSILSESGSLSADTWTSLADSGAEGWGEANPRTDALAELNLDGSQLFSTGTVIQLGQILADGGSQDLVFEYATVNEEVLLGTVEYGSVGGDLPGDCNGDGVVDATDLACVATIQDRDTVLGVLGTLPGDLDGNGDVAFADFLVLSANFNGDNPAYTAGNIDLAGNIDFADFLVLSANFGQTPAALAAVPEPSGLMLLSIGWLGALLRRHRRHA